jgi:FtsP/CotA-like multicopper oxidase with cupredoxin domain
MRLADAHRLRWCSAVLVGLALVLLGSAPVFAQWIPCLGDATTPNQPWTAPDLPTIPELISKDGKLRGTVLLADEQQRLTFKVPPGAAPSDSNTIRCAPQYVRVWKGVGATPAPPARTGPYPDPMPGPTLRARVGDLVQLTFLNQINPANFGDSIDRGDRATGSGCDETSVYPGKTGDTFPDCFHGSSTANIHFHGTHTNPRSTGDNVFLEIRPSLRRGGQPVVTEASVRRAFDAFFDQCEKQLGTSVLSQWPRVWSDLPAAYRQLQQQQLTQYDRTPGVKKLWPVNAAQIERGDWPQYYIGAYPYCFRLPHFTGPFPPPAPAAATHHGGGPLRGDAPRALQMGQAPGTHWYHAHKHGSTAINVANGMTGVFVIEGGYDDALNDFYGKGWTRTQPVLVINQIGVTPNLERGGGGRTDKGPNFSVNGRIRPVMTMAPGEVKLWRIANTSGRAGVFFTGIFAAGTQGPCYGAAAGFQWKQTAQDGVQLIDDNYQASRNPTLTLMAGNRVDLLVMAPTTLGTYSVCVQNMVDPSDLAGQQKTTLFSVRVAGAPASGNAAQFIGTAPPFPAFLADITDAEVSGTKKLVFKSTPPGGAPAAQHTIDGKKFDGDVGAVVLLNKVEEWQIFNETFAAPISHPFHIHINPFQVTEVFDPNQMLTDSAGQTYNRYVFQKSDQKFSDQCVLDLNDRETWKPCGSSGPRSKLLWRDVFPIPSGRQVSGTDAKGQPQTFNVPGYVKMRSRFVDYAGYYVLHCHILAHEDRGMMTVVQVAPRPSPYSHE